MFFIDLLNLKILLLLIFLILNLPKKQKFGSEADEGREDEEAAGHVEGNVVALSGVEDGTGHRRSDHRRNSSEKNEQAESAGQIVQSKLK